METLKFKIEGVVPIVLHNGQLADPLNEFSKALKKLSGQRNKTDDTYEEMAKVEWFGGLYTDKEGYAIIPAECIEATLVGGAKKRKLGKSFKSAVFVEKDARIKYKGMKPAKDLWGNDEFRFTCGVKVGTSRIMRTRPIFRDWSAEIEVNVDVSQLNAEDVQKALEDAGKMIGLCDHRPRYGRFEIVG